MDINMPNLDGKLAVQKIREFEQEKNLLPCNVIMISGNCSASEVNECLNENGKIKAKAFLKKPLMFNDLKHTL